MEKEKRNHKQEHLRKLKENTFLLEEIEQLKKELPAQQKENANLPTKERNIAERELNISLKMIEMILDYPPEGLLVYKANQAKIEVGISFLNEE